MVKELRVLTASQTDTSTFRIRLLFADDMRRPGSDIIIDDLIITALKGKRDLEIDLTDFQIDFPKNGFFAAAEWLIAENYKEEYNYKKEEKLVRTKLRGSCFGIIPAGESTEYWTYINGKWKNRHDKPGKPMNLAMELILTD